MTGPPRRDTTLDCRGSRLAVTLLGEPSDLAPIVVHHGAPGVASRHQSIEAFAFLARSRLVVTFDAVGSGASHPPAAGFSNRMWVEHLAEVATWAGGSGCVVAGLSYGGFLALQYAAGMPANLDALIVCGTFHRGGLTDRALNEISKRSVDVDLDLALRFLDGDVRDAADLVSCFDALRPLYTTTASGQTGPPLDPAVVDPAAHNYAMAAGQYRTEAVANLGRVMTPTLVMVGRHDWITPEPMGRDLAGVLPNARLEVFEHSGHSPFRDEPDRFASVVDEFLASRDQAIEGVR